MAHRDINLCNKECIEFFFAAWYLMNVKSAHCFLIVVDLSALLN